MAHQRNIPILMVLSGGYQKKNADTIAQSLGEILKMYENEGVYRGTIKGLPLQTIPRVQAVQKSI